MAESKNPYIIYHKSDFDGIASAAILRTKYPEARLIPYDYGDPLQIPEEGVRVYMVDISIKPKYMIELALVSEDLIWIDHHQSAIIDYQSHVLPVMEEWAIRSEKPNPITDYYYLGKAACELTWEYIYPDIPIPLAVKLLGRYDIWDHSDDKYWHDYILPFQYGMRMISNDLKSFPKGLLNNDHDTINKVHEIIEIGEQILKYEFKRSEKIAKEKGFEFIWKRHHVIALNGHGGSASFKSIFDKDRHDLMMLFSFDGIKWRVTLYTESDNIDCSKLAKSMGGGGHKKAAGFEVDDFKKIFK